MARERVFSICGMCSVRCPTEVEVEDGRLVRLRGNPHAAGVKGALCPRGAAGVALYEDDERPQHPLIRTGQRGQGQWRRASWDEAFDHVAGKLRAVMDAHGAKAVMLSDRGGPFSDIHRALLRGLGSPNFMSHDPSCASNVQHAALSLFGFGRKSLVYDYANARHVVLQTRNVLEALGVKEANDLLDCLDRGGKLTVIDIRAQITACKADTFLLIRPGTDYAFNLAVIREMLVTGQHDQESAKRLINGYESLFDLTAPYTPEWAEAQTGIPARSLRALVRELAEAAPAVIWHPGWMTSRFDDSFYVSRTAYLINALLGAVGAKGGLPLSNDPSHMGRKTLKSFAGLFDKPKDPRVDGVGDLYPHIAEGSGLLHKALDAALTGRPYPIKAYVAWRHDPLMGFPDQRAVKARLDALDLLVSVTFSWSDTAWYSDVVLPLSTYLERESPLGAKGGLNPQFVMRRRAVAPRFDTKAEWEIVSGLAQRLGVDQLVFPCAEDLWNRQLDGTGVRLEDFDAKGFVSLGPGPLYRDPVFKTPSGRIELVNPLWEKGGQPPLPPYKAPVAPPEGCFRVAFGRSVLHTQGHTVNNPYLFEQMPENVLWIHDSRAEALGLLDGDHAEVAPQSAPDKPVGRLKVKVTPFIHPEAVFLLHGFGHDLPPETRARGRGLADGECMPGGLDTWCKAGGGLNLQEHFVVVRKVEVVEEDVKPGKKGKKREKMPPAAGGGARPRTPARGERQG
ncbi:thiosulfate reductase [Fundidesulfovibrio butyratiphilus]